MIRKLTALIYCARQNINQVRCPRSHFSILKAIPLVFDMYKDFRYSRIMQVIVRFPDAKARTHYLDSYHAWTLVFRLVLLIESGLFRRWANAPKSASGHVGKRLNISKTSRIDTQSSLAYTPPRQ